MAEFRRSQSITERTRTAIKNIRIWLDYLWRDFISSQNKQHHAYCNVDNIQRFLAQYINIFGVNYHKKEKFTEHIYPTVGSSKIRFHFKNLLNKF